MKTIICGSRNGTTYSHLEKAIEECGWQVTEVVSGRAKGADTYGEQWAEINSVPIRMFPAKWNDLSNPKSVIRTDKNGRKYNVLAGLWRNEEMGDYAEACIALWDGSSTGTKHMINYAKSKGLKVFVWNYLDGREM